LSIDQWTAARKLFELIDEDQSGTIEKVEIAAVHGADLFDSMDENDDGVVSPQEWDAFFEECIVSHGKKYTDHILAELNRNVDILQGMKLVVGTKHFAGPRTAGRAAGITGRHNVGRKRTGLPGYKGGMGVSPPRSTPSTPMTSYVMSEPSTGRLGMQQTPSTGGSSYRGGRDSGQDFAQFSGSVGELRDRMATGDIPEMPEMPASVLDHRGSIDPDRFPSLEKLEVTPTPLVVPEELTHQEWMRIQDVYESIDTDNSGDLDAWEIRATVGGDSEGLFNLLDANHDEAVSIKEFVDFFVKLKTLKGGTVITIVIAYLEANVDRMKHEEELLSLPLAPLLLEDWESDELPPVESCDEALISSLNPSPDPPSVSAKR